MQLGSLMTYLPMGLMAGSMVLLYSGGGSGGIRTYMGGGLMGLAMIGMMLGQVGRSASERKRKLRGDRRDYMRYLAQVRKQVRSAIDQQRAAVCWDHPDPSTLWSMARGRRLWERRRSHEDFGEVRVALGQRRARLRLVPPQSKPIEDLEPMCAGALRRFMRAHATVSAVPTSLYLPGMPRVTFDGDEDRLRGLLRAIIAQIVSFHAPDDLRLAVLTSERAAAEWEWAKWLPHLAHPTDTDAAGAVRLLTSDHGELQALLTPTLGGDLASGKHSATTPFLIVIVDGVPIPQDSRLLALAPGQGTVLELPATDVRDESTSTVRLTLEGGELSARASDSVTVLGKADYLGRAQSEALARRIAPCRTTGPFDAAQPFTSDFDMTRLLGIRDVYRYDVHALWRARARSGPLRVPIGVAEDGSVIELDIKESAQGGMGPHGMLIGATGSGKSELLRTIVLTLAATTSSEQLNFVLIDFKGGATFLGLDRLPHTSAVITNLADELPLVDRMQAALHGELIRRQETLRSHGHSSAFEYEKARLKGADLTPFPTLFIVVDEFSELLATKPEFMELFVMIGRLGRSLGVHLLLASQRLDEGRIHVLEGHLSYRLALRTFSAIESRSIIGSTLAHELPSAPGNGFLKVDTTTLVRFKAGYVSGPAPKPLVTASTLPGHAADIVPFHAAFQMPNTAAVFDLEPAVTSTDDDQEDETSLLSIMVDRLHGQGVAARQVWLPPLGEPPTLDLLLPPVEPTPTRGLTATGRHAHGQLRCPVGVIDLPFEQRRDPLIADLNAGRGHVAIVGAPRFGKSTLVRTLVCSLTLTHTAEEVQFYVLDFGGGTLAGLADLPHVGAVASRAEKEKVRRTVADVVGILEHRERAFAQYQIDSMNRYRELRADGTIVDPYGDVFLVVDGWFTMRSEFDDLDTLIAQVAARGLSYGVHLIVTAVRWSEMRPALRDTLATRFELRLGDPIESEVGSRLAAAVPAVPGRGLLKEGLHFLTALPRLDGSNPVGDLATASRALIRDVAEHWEGPTAPDVRMLPSRLAISDLPRADGYRVAIGLDERRLAPLFHDFARAPHLMVFGDSETGKTNLLRVLAESLIADRDPGEIRFLLADARRELHSCVPERYRVGYAVTTDALAEVVKQAAVSMTNRLPGPEITPDELQARDWWHGPELFVFVDDYEMFTTGLIGGPLEPFAPLLAQAAEIGLHLVITRSSSGALRAMADPMLRRLWEVGAPGVLLSYPKEEGKFLGEATPRTLPPGRAQYVTRREVQVVQTAFIRGGTSSEKERAS
jgi:S-DNA-T family DNA segregation ATPase FtsK/SpoIIIE